MNDWLYQVTMSILLIVFCSLPSILYYSTKIGNMEWRHSFERRELAHYRSMCEQWERRCEEIARELDELKRENS